MKQWLISGFITAIALSGCQLAEELRSNRTDYDNPNPPTPTGLTAEPKQSQRGKVISVEDGDTIEIMLNGKEEQIRFCGIDAPEMKQALGQQSRSKLQTLIDGAKGEVIIVVTDIDRYKRKVAEVFVPDPKPNSPENEKLLNYEMVRSGNAFVYPRYVGNCPNGQFIKQAEEDAKQERVGVFQSPDFQKPWDWRQANR